MKISTRVIKYIYILLTISVCIGCSSSYKYKPIVAKHGLVPSTNKKFICIELLKENVEIETLEGKVRWISEASKVYAPELGLKHFDLNAKDYSEFDTVATIVDANEPLFESLIDIKRQYEEVLDRMEEIHNGAKKLYALKQDTESGKRLVRSYLKKVKNGYESLRKISIITYRQGAKVERILAKIHNPLAEARDKENFSKSVAENFANQFSMDDIRIDETSVREALEKTENEMKKISIDTEETYKATMQNLIVLEG